MREDVKEGFVALIAGGQARAGDLKRAIQAISSISDDSVKGFALLDIVSTQAQIGEVASALRTADSIKYVFQQAEALRLIGELQAKTKDRAGAQITLEKALNVALTIPDNSQKADTLRSIARVRGKYGDVKSETAWSLKQESPDLKAYALLGVAEGILERIETRKATQTVTKQPK